MKDKTPPDDKTPHERFVELGKKVMTVPRSQIVSLEKKWQSQKRRRKRRT